MSSSPNRFAALLAAARWRRVFQILVATAPWLLVVLLAAWRFATPPVAAAATTVALVLLTGACIRSLRGIDSRWLARRLDAIAPALEDSAGLLAAQRDGESPLVRLQRNRTQTRLEELGTLDPGPEWRKLPLILSTVTALVSAGAVFWFAGDHMPVSGSVANPAVAGNGSNLQPVPRVKSARILVTPPRYTGLPPREVDGLDVRAPSGSHLAFRVRIEPRPDRVTLRWREGSVLPLRITKAGWTAATVLQRSGLVKLVTGLDREPDAKFHRLFAIRDTAPRVRLLEPARTLVEIGAGTRTQRLEFLATDDYGIRDAMLEINLAQGSGESIRIQSRSVALTGSGPARARRFVHVLDPRDFGMQPDADLIAQLVVRDVRQPQAQVSRSPSVILRWTAPAARDGSDLEGIVQKVLPAYFRSQRQIIVDTEALIAESRKFAQDVLVDRSDRIGVDQRLLRLRYGQFLGEEAEGAPSRPGEPGHGHESTHGETPADKATDSGSRDTASTAQSTNPLFADAYVHGPDASSSPAEHDTDTLAGHHDADGAERGSGALSDHAAIEDGHADGGAAAGFGEAGSVLADFGHSHDLSEAATLLDPATQKLLRAALAEMWQAELHLRQGHPVEALPFEYRALRFIKEVQQADRIYLPKMGVESQPIDMNRRLTGKRDGIRDRPDPLQDALIGDMVLRRMWQVLSDVPANAVDDRVASPAQSAGDAVETWLLQHNPETESTLDTLAALDAWRVSPLCRPCRENLRKLIWMRLETPPVGVDIRRAPDAVARRYLDSVARVRDVKADGVLGDADAAPDPGSGPAAVAP